MKDQYFPAYHFRPEKNWMNDPNGLIWKDGWYHLFYQYNPGADIWGDIHWGHARSRDLLHWEQEPIALAPSREDGEIHCYSGCAVNRGDKTFLFYTSIGEGERGPKEGAEQWSAVSVDSALRVFDKYKKPALGQDIHAPYHVSMWRDPFIWREEAAYRLLLSGTMEGKGCILLYGSENLESWNFISVFYRTERYELIECPAIMKFGERYVLLYSPLDGVRYAIGTIDAKTFTFQVQEEGIFDHSVMKKGFYAANVFADDPKGRYLVMGCLFEGDRLDSPRKRGWAGMQSLPREVRLDEKLKIAPADECRNLRREKLSGLPDMENGAIHARGAAQELFLSYQASPDMKIEMKLFCSADQKECTTLVIDHKKGTILLDRSRSTEYEDVTTEPITASFSPETREYTVDVFTDHSAVELFFDDSLTVSARVFPKNPQSICSEICFSDAAAVTEASIYRLGLS